MKLGHSMTKFLSKSALLFDQDELNFMMLSKSWPYFREHFDLCPLYRSSQTKMVKLVLVHITEQVLLQLVFFQQYFSTRKFVVLSSGRYFFPQAIPSLPP